MALHSETDIAYLAGLFDADGCASSYVQRSKKSNKTVQVHCCEISMTNKEVVYWVKNLVGFGNIFITILYLIAMIFLGSHLRHGFQSAIQTFGIKNTRLGKILIQVSVIFWFFIPLGFFGIAFWFGIINGLL